MLVTNWKLEMVMQGLQYFKTQKNLLNQQVRWWEYSSCFNFNTIHVDCAENKIADCLPHYFENNMGKENHLEHIFVNIDMHLDPEGKLMPTN